MADSDNEGNHQAFASTVLGASVGASVVFDAI